MKVRRIRLLGEVTCRSLGLAAVVAHSNQHRFADVDSVATVHCRTSGSVTMALDMLALVVVVVGQTKPMKPMSPQNLQPQRQESQLMPQKSAKASGPIRLNH